MDQNSRESQDTQIIPGFSVFRTNSNNPDTVAAYPVRCLGDQQTPFVFSTPTDITLYHIPGYPLGMGVTR